MRWRLWPLLAGLLLAACAGASQSPTAIAPPPTIDVGVALDLEGLAPALAGAPAVGAELRVRYLPVPALHAALADREIGLALTTASAHTGTYSVAPVARAALRLVAHPDAGVANLRVADVQALFAGDIANWQALGGPDLPAVVVTREAGTLSRVAFDALVMGGRRTNADALVLTSHAGVLSTVAETPGAVGYVLGETGNGVQLLSVDGTPAGSSSYSLQVEIVALSHAPAGGALANWLDGLRSAALPDGFSAVP